MGVLDKIKNALFEVEYVEVEEPPKKEKKEKKLKKEKIVKEDKPIAKKVVLPGNKEEKVEELREEEVVDEDYEIRPKEEEIVHEEFKFMDDNDFKVEDDVEYLGQYEEPQPIEEEKEEIPPITEAYNNSSYSSGNLYGMNNNNPYNVPIHKYGTYEKEEKTYFKPSPIISPIYGVLDKNYKKEDVKDKKEVRLTGYTRTNMDVDDIRNKAYGSHEEPEEKEEMKFEVEPQDDNIMVDLSDRSKPEVKEITVGDAEEYFEDLGLEYNVDYVDVTTDRNTLKKEEPKEESTPVVDRVMEESNKEIVNDEADDNLFDLIDSMYQENE